MVTCFTFDNSTNNSCEMSTVNTDIRILAPQVNHLTQPLQTDRHICADGGFTVGKVHLINSPSWDCRLFADWSCPYLSFALLFSPR